MNPLIWLFEKLIQIYSFLLLAYVIFNASDQLRDRQRPATGRLRRWRISFRITEPLLAPIRRRMPNFGPIDISPVVLLLLLQFLIVTERYLVRSL